MDLGIRNKLALVTGSTAGIGYAIAKGLLEEGARVVINGRAQARVGQAVDALKASGAAFGVEGDMATAAGADRVAARVNAIGPLDITIEFHHCVYGYPARRLPEFRADLFIGPQPVNPADSEFFEPRAVRNRH